MALNSRICEIFDIRYPIVLAGMGGASVPRLAAAVSNAGGLGILGAAACSPEELRAWIREVRSLTDKPFGVDTLLPASVRREVVDAAAGSGEGGKPSPMELLSDYQAFAADFMRQEGLQEVARSRDGNKGEAQAGPAFFSKEFFEAQMEVVIEEAVPVYAAGLGNPGPWMERLRENGTKVMAVIGSVKHALQVAASGIDVVVAQGHDGGGHNSPIGTMALIPQVVDAMAGRIPVLGAGGIADGRGVAAAMMLGAEGAWVGTAFLATEEAGIQQFQKEVLVEYGDGDTIVSKSVTGKPARIIRNKWAQAWVDAEKSPLPMPFQSIIAGPVLAAATLDQRKDIAPGFAGQGMGLIKAIRPARDVLEDLVNGAETALARATVFAKPRKEIQ
ncbi:NAD(P)H-dependent flavin oxidoreductase [Phenylobacterium sp.]|jgi:NAD(P)H-dependent flavin oxidoreductase YrpB (nitropropane dioxygenase family)|uniref:NAD(P)H-dependent flavin oxidoreductase n=1 Tax=Phenylobacterium sp. TaxID=1871053 RepID=UPI000C8E81AF|nr:2-nitropropane dioxygenase [Phenylobacterium sp.]|tara:strand:+ start:4377 stop:5540 length:1164 start_codon:yes stop_codon:yes gene_type:complete